MGDIPYDPDAEQAVLAGMLLWESVLDDAARRLDAEDFHRPAHRAVFEAAGHVYASGGSVEVSTVASRLRDIGRLDDIGGTAELMAWQNRAPGRTAIPQHVSQVIEKANARRIIRAANDAIDAVTTGTDPDEAADELALAMTNLDSAELDAPVTDIEELTDWALASDEHSSPWVIPGLMRAEWRLLLTATAGAGKATLLRQMCFAASQGWHPFHTDQPIPPVRSLIVDLENPRSTVRPTVGMMARAADAQHTLDRPPPETCAVWPREAGIDMLARHDRHELERRIRHVRPQLVFIGPLYKSFRKDSRRNSDDITEEVCSILDDLRTRYGFALLLEHHSPRGSENLSPFGSSVWDRWPEFGRTLSPSKSSDEDAHRYTFGKFRPDRVKVNWPSAFEWSSPWPWKAIYPQTGAGSSGPDF